MQGLLRNTWAEINLDHLAHNIREVRRVIRPGTRVAAVVKADGYGHGAAAIAGTLLANGADRLAVAILAEALQLRCAFPDTDIMVLGPTPADQARILVERRIIPTVFDLATARALSRAAVAAGQVARIHVKLETGMGRIGMAAGPGAVNRILDLAALPGLAVEGVFTHFATADEPDPTRTRRQFDTYLATVDRLEAAGLAVPLKHVANSAAIIGCRDYDLDMVRPGIMLYGLYPSRTVSHEAVDLKEVMALRTRIAQVKQVPPGTGISYGHAYVTRQAEAIATLPVGYADGYSRLLSGRAVVQVDGTRVPVVGRICMDQCMINVTGLKVGPGDPVTLFGGDGAGKVWIEDVADWLGTNTHEVIGRIDKRVPRLYRRGGRVVQVRDYLLELQGSTQVPGPARGRRLAGAVGL